MLCGIYQDTSEYEGVYRDMWKSRWTYKDLIRIFKGYIGLAPNNREWKGNI